MAPTSKPGVWPDVGSLKSSIGKDAQTNLGNVVSGSEIFAGVAVGLVVQVLKTLLGLRNGAATPRRRTAMPK